MAGVANCDSMWSRGAFGLWHLAYRRVVRSTFATVPHYRHRWALSGRTDPVLVPGRTGTHGGAILPAEAESALIDLIPLAGGQSAVDPVRGLGPVLGPLPSGALVVVLDEDGASVALAELTATLARGGTVLAVGTDKQLISLAGALPAPLAVRLGRRPRCELDQLDGGPYGLIHDRLLGYLGAFGGCGRWHVDWPRVYVRKTDAGLAFTLLRQDSPRFVDILVNDGVPGTIAPCPRHGTPVVLT